MIIILEVWVFSLTAVMTERQNNAHGVSKCIVQLLHLCHKKFTNNQLFMTMSQRAAIVVINAVSVRQKRLQQF